MMETLRRLVMFFFIACAVSYAIFLVTGRAINAAALDESRTVLVRDSLKPGIHHLSGIVMVHRTCADLSVRSEKIDTTVYRLIFTTWEDPSVQCANDDTPRTFRTAVVAPAAGVQFIASLDGDPLRLSVYQLVDVQ